MFFYSRFSVRWRASKSSHFVCILFGDWRLLTALISIINFSLFCHTFTHSTVIFSPVRRHRMKPFINHWKRIKSFITMANVIQLSITVIAKKISTNTPTSSRSRTSSTVWNPSPVVFLEVCSRLFVVWYWLISITRWNMTSLFWWRQAFHCSLVWWSRPMNRKQRSERGKPRKPTRSVLRFASIISTTLILVSGIWIMLNSFSSIRTPAYHVSQNCALDYEHLVIVTENFTRDATRQNCIKIAHLTFNRLILQSKEMHSYFPHCR